MAGKTIGRNTNVNDGTDAAAPVVLSNAVTLNATTSVKVVDANDNRIYFVISNPSSKQIWLKFQPTATDNDKKGVVVFGRSNYEMPVDNIYTGEVSAISESGTPDIFVTEY